MCKVATNNEINKTVKGPMTRLKWVPKADTSKVLQRASARPVLSRASIFFSSVFPCPEGYQILLPFLR